MALGDGGPPWEMVGHLHFLPSLDLRFAGAFLLFARSGNWLNIVYNIDLWFHYHTAFISLCYFHVLLCVSLPVPSMGRRSDLSSVTGINHVRHFTLQAKYLVRLKDECCCSARCKGRLLRHESSTM